MMSEGSVSGSSSQSKSLMWMMTALFAGFAVLLGGGLFIASRVVRSMGLSAANSRDTISTPGGSLRAQKENQVGPAMPVYPRAALVLPSSNDVGAELKNRNVGTEVATYETSDVQELVDSWYLKHLSAEFTRHDANENPLPDVLRDLHLAQSDIAFVAQRSNLTRIVTLSSNSDGTKISLLRMDKPEPATP